MPRWMSCPAYTIYNPNVAFFGPTWLLLPTYLPCPWLLSFLFASDIDCPGFLACPALSLCHSTITLDLSSVLVHLRSHLSHLHLPPYELNPTASLSALLPQTSISSHSQHSSSVLDSRKQASKQAREKLACLPCRIRLHPDSLSPPHHLRCPSEPLHHHYDHPSRIGSLTAAAQPPTIPPSRTSPSQPGSHPPLPRQDFVPIKTFFHSTRSDPF
ncbi:hypothetical protein LY76DRAFT_165419 [Colletotrichum caudatum]|nr:hypothetical protein LY76DRAFT_165419 [Colletotrichum caudatum]